jgi:hypothetical protein
LKASWRSKTFCGTDWTLSTLIVCAASSSMPCCSNSDAGCTTVAVQLSIGLSVAI